MDKTQWEDFNKDIKSIFDSVIENKSGNVADYIPQLANVNEDSFGISIVTVDNREINIGDYDETFCIQSCSKPFTYALALEEHGSEKVAEHIGIEPSGQSFNAFVFNTENKPFNALINSGAIVATSLVRPNDTDDKRYEYIISRWQDVVGKKKVGFDNAVYLSERRTADRNRALSYVMRENGVFMDDTDIERTLELYFQFCSITMNSNSLAKFAAMLANGGKTVDTHKKILQSSVVKDVLCVMYSSGMYNYSGRWAHKVGLPAKSGVSGTVFVVIPKVCGICIYSPRLDEIGNSSRAVEFLEKLVGMYRFHIFDTLVSGLDKKKQFMKIENKLADLCHACYHNNASIVTKILTENGIDINEADYDGRRPLHIATEAQNHECVEILLQYGADYKVEDKWGMTPLKKAIELSDEILMNLFK